MGTAKAKRWTKTFCLYAALMAGSEKQMTDITYIYKYKDTNKNYLHLYKNINKYDL